MTAALMKESYGKGKDSYRGYPEPDQGAVIRLTHVGALYANTRHESRTACPVVVTTVTTGPGQRVDVASPSLEGASHSSNC